MAAHAGTTSLLVGELVRDLIPASSICSALAEALTRIDYVGNTSSSLLIRPVLAKLVVSNPLLLQRNFSRHSAAELATSQTLQSIAQTMKSTQLRQDLIDHSADEMRHSRMFGALAHNIHRSTGETCSENYDWTLANDRHFVETYSGDVIDFVCDLFAGEVRTHHFLATYIDALACAPNTTSDRTLKVLQQVLEDERRHIRYTAGYINQWMLDGLELTSYLLERFRAFDKNSWIDVAATARFFYEESLVN